MIDTTVAPVVEKGATVISDWLNITGPSLSMAPVELTHGSSPDKFREFIAGLRDAGELSVELQFAPASTGHAVFIADFISGTTATYTIQWVSGAGSTIATFTFSAFVISVEPSTPHDDKVGLNVTWKITGKPTFTQP